MEGCLFRLRNSKICVGVGEGAMTFIFLWKVLVIYVWIFLCKLIYVWKAEGLRSVLNSWMDSLRHFTM